MPAALVARRVPQAPAQCCAGPCLVPRREAAALFAQFVAQAGFGGADGRVAHGGNARASLGITRDSRSTADDLALEPRWSRAGVQVLHQASRKADVHNSNEQ